MNPEYATMNNLEIEGLIAELQDVQKRNHPISKEWQDASTALRPLFAEMAERTSEAS